MANSMIKTVNVNAIKPNMILARDVVTKKGIVIMAKNTMLNNVNFAKLYENGINTVGIWANSIDETLENMTVINDVLTEQLKPVTERTEYKSFASSYEAELKNAKDTLITIGKGGDINVDSLYTITTEILSKINSKSDIFSYLSYLKQKDDHTYSHCVNVSLLCNLFSKWAGMDEDERRNLTVSGMLHDIGKTMIDPAVLNKKGKLTPNEFDKVKKHAYLGYKLIESADLPDEVKMAVLMHHERVDGSGYPMAVKGNRIGKFAKIVAICDIYDAMTSTRVYRPKICPFEVIRNFEQSSFSVLDAEYLLIFLQNIAYTYVGSWVELSNGKTAEVVFINKSHLSRPMVKCDGEFIDLSQNKQLQINHLI